ncbi:hypothetical protein B484DRAFT_472057 [Ochromonadaceae sp. CCMP2298]|nr:hypothetical protein B484DRAFT_429993 [Ochromonadaceae sp. CCMP2298]KAJ1436187.1 hypothetical protein B484DRAFT_472057 [Ochromonadaceae sp. CCMP2298]
MVQLHTCLAWSPSEGGARRYGFVVAFGAAQAVEGLLVAELTLAPPSAEPMLSGLRGLRLQAWRVTEVEAGITSPVTVLEDRLFIDGSLLIRPGMSDVFYIAEDQSAAGVAQRLSDFSPFRFSPRSPARDEQQFLLTRLKLVKAVKAGLVSSKGHGRQLTVSSFPLSLWEWEQLCGCCGKLGKLDNPVTSGTHVVHNVDDQQGRPRTRLQRSHISLLLVACPTVLEPILGTHWSRAFVSPEASRDPFSQRVVEFNVRHEARTGAGDVQVPLLALRFNQYGSTVAITSNISSYIQTPAPATLGLVARHDQLAGEYADLPNGGGLVRILHVEQLFLNSRNCASTEALGRHGAAWSGILPSPACRPRYTDIYSRAAAAPEHICMQGCSAAR